MRYRKPSKATSTRRASGSGLNCSDLDAKLFRLDPRRVEAIRVKRDFFHFLDHHRSAPQRRTVRIGCLGSRGPSMSGRGLVLVRLVIIIRLWRKALVEILERVLGL